MRPDRVDAIDAVLPQTQCRQCGFDGCRPYAAAIAAGTASIDRCPPGGAAGVAKLAAVTGCRPIPLDPRYGVPKPLALAVVDEAICIGCTLCIQACPVDAIVGGAKRLHDVVADLCTGCELCVAPCPVDCIRMEPAGFEWTVAHAADARSRHHARARRLHRIACDEGRAPAREPADRRNAAAVERHDDGQHRGPDDATRAGLEERSGAAEARAVPADVDPAATRRRAIIDAAVARAAARRASRPSNPQDGPR